METQSPRHNKTNTIAFRVTQEQFNRLTEFSKAEGYKNLSQWMQQLVKDEIEMHDLVVEQATGLNSDAV